MDPTNEWSASSGHFRSRLAIRFDKLCCFYRVFVRVRERGLQVWLAERLRRIIPSERLLESANRYKNNRCAYLAFDGTLFGTVFKNKTKNASNISGVVARGPTCDSDDSLHNLARY